MKFYILIFISIILSSIEIKAQAKRDTSTLSHPSEKKANISPSIENKFDPKSSFKIFKDDFTLPYDLKKYSAIMSLDVSSKNKFTEEELSSGLSHDEIDSFNENKKSTKRMLAEFYGEDFIDVEKLLESIGLSKDQLVGILMVLKFVFGQALLK